jgi:hypothetical protein
MFRRSRIVSTFHCLPKKRANESATGFRDRYLGKVPGDGRSGSVSVSDSERRRGFWIDARRKRREAFRSSIRKTRPKVSRYLHIVSAQVCSIGSDRSIDLANLNIAKTNAEAVGSASLHPYLPYLLTATGTRHFDAEAAGLDSEDSSEEEDDGDLKDAHPSLGIFRFGEPAAPG